MTLETVESQLAALRAGINADTAPDGIALWWGNYLSLPTGATGARVMSQLDWEGHYATLSYCCSHAGMLPPLYKVQGIVAEYAESDAVPLALVNLDASRLRRAPRLDMMRHAANGSPLTEPLPDISAISGTRHVFMLGALQHEQWGRTTPVHKGRVVRFKLDERLYFGNFGRPLPTEMELDAGDGRGYRAVQRGETVLCTYKEAGEITVSLRARVDGDRLDASASLTLVDEKPAPIPDETWPLIGSWSSRGTAYVYRATAPLEERHFVLISEGFPGGYPRDYLYAMLNQHGTLEKLRARGYDIVLVSYLNGADFIERNADVIDACLREAAARSGAPVVVGGVSMGGLITRYALARSEARGVDHNARVLFTIDTPHTGSYTSLAAQWFAERFAQAVPHLGLMAALLASPANQEFVRTVLINGQPATSPLRTAFLAALAAVGEYPRKLKSLAIASGRGDGKMSTDAPDTILSWQGSALVNATLKVLPASDAGEQVIASGHSFLGAAGFPDELRMSSDYCWENAPGGQNTYGAVTAYAAGWTGCGAVEGARAMTCSIPTASALGMQNVAPDEAIPGKDDPRCDSPFDDFIHADENMPHVGFDAAASQWLIDHLATPETIGS